MANPVRSILDTHARRKGLLYVWCLMCHRVKRTERVALVFAGVSDGLHEGCVDAYREKYCGGGKRVA